MSRSIEEVLGQESRGLSPQTIAPGTELVEKEATPLPVSEALFKANQRAALQRHQNSLDNSSVISSLTNSLVVSGRLIQRLRLSELIEDVRALHGYYREFVASLQTHSTAGVCLTRDDYPAPDLLSWITSAQDVLGEYRKQVEAFLDVDLSDLTTTPTKLPVVGPTPEQIEAAIKRWEESGLEVVMNQVTNLLSVRTERIVLTSEEGDEIDLGPFCININCQTYGTSIEALEPNGPASRNAAGITHPNVRHNQLCWGNAENTHNEATKVFDFLLLVDAALELLRTYGDEAPYWRLCEWNDATEECSNCGRLAPEDDTYTCRDCDNSRCDNCIQFCAYCSRESCCGMDICTHCDESCCEECRFYCGDSCDETTCLRCCRQCLAGFNCLGCSENHKKKLAEEAKKIAEELAASDDEDEDDEEEDNEDVEEEETEATEGEVAHG